MKHLRNVLLATAALAPVPAAALDFGNGFSLTGDVELEYVSPENSDDIPAGFTDLTLSWRNAGSGGLGFGVDLAVESVHDLDEGDDASAVWLGLVLGTSFGEFSVGRPRPLHDTMFDTPDIGATKLLDYELVFFRESLMSSLVLLADGTVNPYGLTYLGQSGGFTYGAGLHRVEDGSESIDFVELVAKYQMGATEVYGGIELADGDGGDLDKYIIGGSYDADRWLVGAQVLHFSEGPSDATSIKLYGEYEVTEALAIGLQVQDIDEFGDGTIYGISGSYSFGSGGFAELGFVSFDTDSGSSDAASASVGFRF